MFEKKSMKKILLVGTIIFIVGAGLATGIGKLSFNLTVETDKSQYFAGEVVNISGRVTENGYGVPDIGVCINVTDPDESMIHGICTDTNAEGYYYDNFILSSSATLGVYNVLAEDDIHEINATTEFAVITGYRLTVETEESRYNPGEQVNISGRLTENGTGVPNSGVCINISDPSHSLIYGTCMDTNAEGYYYDNFILSSSATLGTYKVTVDDHIHNVNATSKFEVFVAVVCGDCNNDSVVDLGDVVYIVNYLFRGGNPPIPVRCAGDCNGDGSVDLGDVVYIVNYLFKGGNPPVDDCCG